MSSSRLTNDDLKGLSLAEQHEWFTKKRSSRRSLLKGGIVGAGALLTSQQLLAPGVAEAATASDMAMPDVLLTSDRIAKPGVVPFGRVLSFGADPTTQMNISWVVSGPVSSPFVRIGTSPINLSHRIPAEVKAVHTPWKDITDFLDSVPPLASVAKLPEEQYYVHASVDHLMPGTTYYYSVGHAGLDPASGPQLQALTASFTTAPRQATPFTFTAFGDQGSTYDSIAATNLVAAQHPAFHLHAGDISYANSGGSGSLTDSYDPRIWDSYFSVVTATAAYTPWMTSLGNHEMEPWYSPDGYGADVKRMSFPGNGPTICPGTYVFRYGNAAFISLDPNDVSYEIPANLDYSDGTQTSWLDTTLAGLRSNKAVDFIVVFFHHCAYCTCVTHGSEGGVRKFWTPLFDKHQVDLVINGHNHVYERTDPIRHGVATTTAPTGATVHPATDGTTYLTHGASGKSLYSFSAPDSYAGNVSDDSAVKSYINEPKGTMKKETVEWSRVRFTGYGVIAVDVTPPSAGKAKMVVRFVDENAQELDHVTLVRSA